MKMHRAESIEQRAKRHSAKRIEQSVEKRFAENG